MKHFIFFLLVFLNYSEHLAATICKKSYADKPETQNKHDNLEPLKRIEYKPEIPEVIFKEMLEANLFAPQAIFFIISKIVQRALIEIVKDPHVLIQLQKSELSERQYLHLTDLMTKAHRAYRINIAIDHQANNQDFRLHRPDIYAFWQYERSLSLYKIITLLFHAQTQLFSEFYGKEVKVFDSEDIYKIYKNLINLSETQRQDILSQTIQSLNLFVDFFSNNPEVKKMMRDYRMEISKKYPGRPTFTQHGHFPAREIIDLFESKVLSGEIQKPSNFDEIFSGLYSTFFSYEFNGKRIDIVMPDPPKLMGMSEPKELE